MSFLDQFLKDTNAHHRSSSQQLHHQQQHQQLQGLGGFDSSRSAAHRASQDSLGAAAAAANRDSVGSSRSNASASDLSPSSELYSQPLGAAVVPPPGARMQGQPPPPPPPAAAAPPTPHQQGMIQVGPKAKAHQFLIRTFSSPLKCNHCTSIMVGLTRQGVVCEVCGFACHIQCREKVPATCPVPPDQSEWSPRPTSPSSS